MVRLSNPVLGFSHELMKLTLTWSYVSELEYPLLKAGK